MNKKNKFIARTTSYFPVNQNIESSKKINHNLPEINISNFTLQHLLVDLQKTINKPSPRIFKGWRNRQVRLDVEYQHFIIEQIQNLRRMNEEYIHLQAEAIFSHEMVNKLVDGMRAEAEILAKNNALKLLQADQAFELSPIQHEDEKLRIKHIQELRKRELKKLDLELMREQAEINDLNAKTKKEKAIATFIGKSLDNIEVEKMSDEIKYLIVDALVNPSGHDYSENYIKQQMSKYVVEQSHEKTKQEKIQTEKMGVDKDLAKAKGKAAVNAINKIGNSDKGK